MQKILLRILKESLKKVFTWLARSNCITSDASGANFSPPTARPRFKKIKLEWIIFNLNCAYKLHQLINEFSNYLHI